MGGIDFGAALTIEQRLARLEQKAILQSLLSTRGDLIRRGASGPERVGLGASGTVLTSDGADAVWSTPASVSLTAPLIGGAAQHGTSGSELVVSTWQTEGWDDSAMHDASTNPGRITPGQLGTFDFKASIGFTAAATSGFVYVALKKNGAVLAYGDILYWVNSASINTNASVVHQDRVTSLTDYYEVAVFQSTGGVRTFALTSYFQASRIRV